MKDIIYYSYPHYFDVAIHYLDQIDSKFNVTFFLELHPNNFQTSMFNLSDFESNFGIYDGKKYLHRFSQPIVEVLNTLGNFFIIFFPEKFITKTTYLILKQLYNLISNFSVFHFDDISPRASLLIFLLKSDSRLIILNVHDTFQHSGEKLIFYKLLKKIIYAKSNYLIIFNKFSKIRFIKKYSLNWNKVIDTKLGKYYLYTKFLRSSNSHSDYFLFLGRFSTYKGIDTLLGAIKKIRLNYPELYFIFAGKSSYGYCLKEENLPPNVKLLNRYIENHELAELIEFSKAVILPYKDITQSGVLMTAMAFSKPVIASDTGSFPEYIIDRVNGILFKTGDIDDLAEKIEFLLKDSNIYQKIVENLKNESNGWEEFSSKLINLYEKL